MSAQIVRLTSGEELLATVKSTSTGLTLSDIAILIPTQQNSLGLAPFMAYGDYDEIHIDNKDIMFTIKAVKELAGQHQEMFRKIVTPTTNIIT